MAYNLRDVKLPSEDELSFKSVFDFFEEWKDTVTLHKFDYNGDTDKLEVAYVHVSGCHPRLLKNANTLLRCYLNSLADLGLCNQVRLRVWG